MRPHLRSLTALSLLAAALLPRAADAGCGCDKPPPPPAAVRPTVAYPGASVSFFGSALRTGTAYTVTFTSGTSSATASVQGQAATRRDLADGVAKVQLTVALPKLPPGPARITVRNASTQILAVADTQFTVAPAPIAVPSAYGEYTWSGYQAAVGRDGVVYIALDLSAVHGPMVVDAQALGYPLRYGNGDVSFHNVQGFLMQLLTQQGGRTPIPGMFVFPADANANSDTLRYSRHEFVTYFLQHAERMPHQVDPSDPNWHVDGSRHVDHDHLIIEIAGQLADGSTPRAGATPPFTLDVSALSLFHEGLVGASSVTLYGTSTIDSYDPATGQLDANGDVFTNGTLTLGGSAIISGDATASSFSVTGSAAITGNMVNLGQPETFMDVKIPAGIAQLGSFTLNGTSGSINGPGSFAITDLTLNKGANLYIDNSRGPVTLYLTGQLALYAGSTITVADPNPEKFAVYMASGSPASLNGGSNSFYGVIYAPYSSLTITSSGELYGAFVADSLSVPKSGRIHYDKALRGN